MLVLKEYLSSRFWFHSVSSIIIILSAYDFTITEYVLKLFSWNKGTECYSLRWFEWTGGSDCPSINETFNSSHYCLTDAALQEGSLQHHDVTALISDAVKRYSRTDRRDCRISEFVLFKSEKHRKSRLNVILTAVHVVNHTVLCWNSSENDSTPSKVIWGFCNTKFCFTLSFKSSNMIKENVCELINRGWTHEWSCCQPAFSSLRH